MFHLLGEVGSTASCVGPDCFSENQGDIPYNGLAQMVNATGAGLFPETWSLTLKQDARLVEHNCISLDGISDGDVVLANKELIFKVGEIALFGNKVRACKLSFKVPADDYNVAGLYYHEHFASNPPTECLGWMECEQSVWIPDKPEPIPPDDDMPIPPIPPSNPVE